MAKRREEYYHGQRMIVYGPYHGAHCNFLIMLNMDTQERKSIIHARYLLEKHLHRPLTDDEIVYRKDGNSYNDDLSNLEIVTLEESRRLIALQLFGEPYQEYTCEQCGKTFTRKASVERMQAKLKPGKGIFCSKKCLGISHRLSTKGVANVPA